MEVLENEWGLSVIAVTVHVHYLLQRRETFVTAAAGVVTISIPPMLSPRSRRHCLRSRTVETRTDGKGGYSVTPPCAMLDRLKLKSLRGPRESYSDVILRLATAD